jgi:hypothetical protein
MQHGTRSYIRVLRLLEKCSLAQLAAAVEYAVDIDVIDARTGAPQTSGALGRSDG